MKFNSNFFVAEQEDILQCHNCKKHNSRFLWVSILYYIFRIYKNTDRHQWA